MNQDGNRSRSIDLKTIATFVGILGFITLLVPVFFYPDNTAVVLIVGTLGLSVIGLAAYMLTIANKRVELERQVNELDGKVGETGSHTFANGEWNRPGRFLSGPFYKFTTLNLLSVVSGFALIAVAAFFLFKPNNIPSPLPGDPGTVCGSKQFPAEEQTRLRPNYGGYGMIRELDHAAEADCIDARNASRDRGYAAGIPGLFLFAGGMAIGATRKPKDMTWGSLQRRPSSRELFEKLQAEESSPVDRLAPGWYPDQADQGSVRWFDGAQWTSATLPREGWRSPET